MVDEAVLTYRAASTASVLGQQTDVRLAVADQPTGQMFFDGFLTHGEQAAAALLLVAKVARTRFYTPPNMVAAMIDAADPVVTANTDRLRFESFSACCGVAARYDILPAGLDRPPTSPGTTNVDLNPPVRAALADVRGLDPLHLAVGTDVTVTTMDAQIVERKVPLPPRWVRGFAEAQASAAGLVRRAVLPIAQVRRFLRGLPAASGGKSVLYAVPGRDGLRLTASPAPAAIPLGGPSRLRVLEALLPYASSLTAYGPGSPGSGVSLWQLDLPDARFSLALSPTSMRGFSGEGGLLFDLANEQAAHDSLLVSTLLAYDPVIDPGRLAREAGLAEGRVLAALTHLATAGQVGFDAAESAYFKRELPWDRGALEKMHPRLADARELLAGGAVRVNGDRAEVQSNGGTHHVRLTADGRSCTCPWFAQHRRSRGPCKHILAVELLDRAPAKAP